MAKAPGLNSEIELAVRMFKPRTLAELEEEVLETEEIIEWKLYGDEFRTDVMVIPLGGCEMVLGTQWLSTVCDILSNFKKLRMDIKHNGRKAVLRGTQKADLQWMQGNKMLIQTPRIELSSVILCVYSTITLHIIAAEESKEIHEVISKMLDNYTDVLSIPTALPPIRSCDHQIPLKEGIISINSRPYKHPPTQKDAIEVMVRELLDTELNNATIKDKFPIPVIEELIDEVFFDDILVYSPTLEDHVKHLEVVLQALRQNILYAKQSKCVFGTKQVEYLGHLITKEGVATDNSKIEAMKNWPKLTNLKQLRGFWGLTRHYRRFVKDYAVISYPLTRLLKKNGFGWNPTTQEAFDNLKQAMVESPVLKLPNFNELFVIETDASQTGIGAVLQQGGYLVAYYSKSLATRHLTLSTYEKELLAVIQALNKWRGYLLDRHFKIKTDHFSLKYLLEQRITTHAQMKWLPKLISCDYDILYKKGSENKADDALSRIPTSAQLLTLALSIISTNPQSHKHYTWTNGQLRRKGKLVVGNNEALRQQLLQYFHSDPSGGHSGVQATIKRITGLCYWKKLRQQVNVFMIFMDFIEGLPSSYGKTVIFVVMDRLSKYVHFVPLSHPFTATHIAQVFLDNVYKLHGLPKIIVSDRDKIFLSLFWKELFKALQVSLHLSTAYHPQSDGQTEVVLYGQPPPNPIAYVQGHCLVDVVDRTLATREAMIQLLHFYLTRAQDRMKAIADAKRTDREFVVGQWVYLKLQPHRQVTVRLGKYNKLNPKYYGSFQILKRVGQVAYHLELPKTSQIHLVFHVSQLKKYKGPIPIATTILPQCNNDGELLSVPVEVLDRRLGKVRNVAQVYVLIRWSNGIVDDATWELHSYMAKRFLDFRLDA
ncbi:transposon ty3-I gag-pol polyprotein [Tanacetum coccineum]